MDRHVTGRSGRASGRPPGPDRSGRPALRSPLAAATGRSRRAAGGEQPWDGPARPRRRRHGAMKRRRVLPAGRAGSGAPGARSVIRRLPPLGFDPLVCWGRSSHPSSLDAKREAALHHALGRHVGLAEGHLYAEAVEQPAEREREVLRVGVAGELAVLPARRGRSPRSAARVIEPEVGAADGRIAGAADPDLHPQGVVTEAAGPEAGFLDQVTFNRKPTSSTSLVTGSPQHAPAFQPYCAFFATGSGVSTFGRSSYRRDMPPDNRSRRHWGPYRR